MPLAGTLLCDLLFLDVFIIIFQERILFQICLKICPTSPGVLHRSYASLNDLPICRCHWYIKGLYPLRSGKVYGHPLPRLLPAAA
jgi:hypothetical protein